MKSSTLKSIAEGHAEAQGCAGISGRIRACVMPLGLRETSPSADPVTRTYAARFSVLEPPQFIGLGMTATLGFERPDARPVAEVPLSAIFQRGTQPTVWVVDRDSGTVELRPVKIARWRDDTAAILSGVKDGQADRHWRAQARDRPKGEAAPVSAAGGPLAILPSGTASMTTRTNLRRWR